MTGRGRFAVRGIIVLCTLCVLSAGSGTPIRGQAEFFTEGNQRYQAGDYAGALDDYLAIVEAGFESAALYYNIGNTYFKLGDLGRAILFYERARRLSPRDADVLANLDLARSLTADDITPLPRFWLFRAVSWWVHLLPVSWLTMIVLSGYLVAAGGMIVFIVRRGTSRARWGLRLSAAVGSVALILAVNLVAIELEIGVSEDAIVMADEVTVQSAPAEDTSLQIFVIHQGTKVHVDRRSEDWVEIVLEDGKVGWVRAGVLEII